MNGAGGWTELALQFEAACQLPAEDWRVVMEVRESLNIRCQVRRWELSKTSSG